MQIRYVKANPAFSRDFGESDWERSIAFIDLALEQEPSKSVGDRFGALAPENRGSNLIVFRTNSIADADMIAADTIIRSELVNRSVHILALSHHDGKFEMQIQPVEGFSTTEVPLPLETFRQVELESLLAQNGCLLFPDDAHFSLPNGLHTNGFIHIAKALRDPLSLSRLADWILPYVDHNTALLTDTQSMISLLLQIKCKALEAFAWKLEFTSLHEYASQSDDIVDCVRDLKDRSRGLGRTLFLLSVNSSGNTANQFKIQCPGSKTIALCHTRNDTPKELDAAFITIPLERWEPNEHAECQTCDKLNLIYIDRETLEPRPKATRDNRKPDISKAEAKRGFWEAASRSNAVRLHVSIKHGAEGDQTRHHSIYIDTRRLISDDVFRNLCRKKLGSISRPDLVIIPSHGNSDVVEDLVRQGFEDSIPAIEIAKVRNLRQILQFYPKVRRILIADDGIVTGSTVRDFKIMVYQAYQPSGSIPDLDCFVIIARPPNRRAWDSVSRPMRERDAIHITYGELIYLPYAEQKCPWCQERRILEGFAHKLDDLSGPAKRSLQDRVTELRKEVEFPLLVPSPSGYLTLRSFFGKLNARTAFAAMSSVMQTLVDEIDEKPNPFKLTAVDLSLTLEAYFEAVFPAGAFRTLDKRYCVIAEHEQRINEFIETYLSDNSYPGLVAELSWAAVQGKLPTRPILGLLDRIAAEHPMTEVMHKLLHLLSMPSNSADQG